MKTSTAGLLVLALGSGIYPAPVQAIYQVDGLCRRWGHQATVVDNTLWLFGGKRSRDTGDQVVTETNTDFLSLDLGERFDLGAGKVPWNNVSILSPPDLNPPAVQQGALFYGAENKLYLFEGQVPETEAETRTSSIYEFNTVESRWNGTSDEWDWPEPGDRSWWPKRKSRGAPVQVGESRAFYIGGLMAYENSTFKGWHYPDENQVVEIDTKKGKRIASKSELRAGRLPMKRKRIGPRAVYIGGLGDKGMIALVGGTDEYMNRAKAPRAPNGDKNSGLDPDTIRINSLAPMDTLWLYDIKTSRWHWQTTTGNMDEIPFTRKNFCLGSISVDDPEPQHLIFLYGGGSDYNVSMFGTNDTTYDDMFVLSLPSFRWQRVKIEDRSLAPAARQLATCHVVGNQMIMVGGMSQNSSAPEPTNCTWDEMSVFDMSALKFKSSFEPNNTPYQIPQLLKQGIGDSSNPATEWDDYSLQMIFKGKDNSGCPQAEKLNDLLGRTQATTRSAVAAAGILGALALIGLGSTMMCQHRRKRDNEEMNVQIEHLKYLFGYQDPESTYGGANAGKGFVSGSGASGTFVYEETARDMTFLDKVKWKLGINRNRTALIGGFYGGGGGYGPNNDLPPMEILGGPQTWKMPSEKVP